jgi:hypothetical protein
MGAVCNMRGRNMKCIANFGRETRRELLVRPKRKGNIILK